MKKSINIDNSFDLLVAESLIKSGNCNNKPKIINTSIKKNIRKNKSKILITAPLHFIKNLEKKFLKTYECIITKTDNINKLAKLLNDVEVWLCSPCPNYRINKKILNNAKNLKLIVPSTEVIILIRFFVKKKVSK